MRRRIEKIRPPLRFADSAGHDVRATGGIIDDSAVDEIVEEVIKVQPPEQPRQVKQDTFELSEQAREAMAKSKKEKEE